MTLAQYTYSKSVDLGRLEQEIKDSTITIALDHLDETHPGHLDIWFKAFLSTAEENELTAIVDSHVNTPLPSAETRNVAVTNLMKGADNKLIVYPTPQPNSTDFVLSSLTDSAANDNGDLLFMRHTVYQHGEDTEGIDQTCGLFVNNGGGGEFSQYWLNSKYLDFYTISNRTFIINGGCSWYINCPEYSGVVAVSLGAVTSVFDPTSYEVASGMGNAALVDGYLLVPMPGLTGGTHNLPIGTDASQLPQPMAFTEMTTVVLTGEYIEPAFWQIDYNRVTDEFFNLQPTADPYAVTRDLDTGDPTIRRIVGNLFAVEIPLVNFVKDLLLIGSSNGFFDLKSVDATELGYGIRARLDCKTIIGNGNVNVPWVLSGYLKSYREYTT